MFHRSTFQALVFFSLALVLVSLAALPGRAEWKVAGADENSFIKLGFLAQGRAQVEDGAVNTREQNDNLYLRRFRILIGGKINSKLSFFFETDSPDMGKYLPKTTKAANDIKNEPNVYIQDFYATYTFSDVLMIDGGMMLIPVSRNSEQSAATLLAIDYGPYTFLASTPTQSRVGRDYGVQARGYLFDKHFEYRAGVYQGDRDLGKKNNEANSPFRYTGRLVYYFFEPETGFFYSGTTLGKKQILSVGGGMDAQDQYRAYSGDLFWDQPVASGDAFTFQVNYIYYDGDVTFKTLHAQNDWLYEVSYYFGAAKLSPFAQIATRDYVQEKYQDEARWQGGLIYWGSGHNFNLKLGYTVISRPHISAKDSGNQVHHYYGDMYTLQCQVFMF